MAIISRIGHRQLKARALIFAIYTALLLGAVTMVYPFLLMVSGSTKSNVDTPDPKVIPRFLVNEPALWQKHAEGLFNESIEMMRQVYDVDTAAFDKVETPAVVNAKFADAWLAFLEKRAPEHYYYSVGYIRCPASRGTVPKAMRDFKSQLAGRYEHDIDKVNAAMGTQFASWSAFWIAPEDYILRRNKPGTSAFHLELRKFKAEQPEVNRYYFSVDGAYKVRFIKNKYSKDIEGYNKEHGTAYASYAQVHLDRRLPAGEGRTELERKDWEDFVRTLLNLLWIRADESAAPAYRGFLAAKYGDIANFNRRYSTTWKSFDVVPLIRSAPEEGLALSDWDAFLQGWKDPDSGVEHTMPAESIIVHSLELQFRDHLKERHATLDAVNAALGTSFEDWMEVMPPQESAHYLAFKGETGRLRKEFVVRNYVTVADHIVLHGRGVFNTVVYCLLAVLSALIVNPLAAYALSRYKPPSSYKVLLFLMMTMAFPPMVTQIPVFLMLRDFNLLNTFWALILPGLANGYSIFLLKGFFDSLPQELYESAEIDGAGEFRIFWQITMSLSKPILAVIALNAFTLAYSNFMFALLLCQDQRMWTLMVWLYRLQSRSGQGVVFASLIIAAIPTFLIFALCQNIIMRGIVVPVEK